MSSLDKAIKRAFDIVFSMFGLVLLWPVILLCALVALRDTKVSGFYSQGRIGRYGKAMNIHKIRTMRFVEGSAGNAITTDRDPRVSPSGRLMRRLKLDELPQLWNVLVGEMSLVGPRPDVAGYADCLQGDDRRLLELRPGITGPASIKYRDEERLLGMQVDPKDYNDRVIYPDKVCLNLDYLDNWSFAGDIRYLLVTVGVLKPPVSLDFPVEALSTEPS